MRGVTEKWSCNKAVTRQRPFLVSLTFLLSFYFYLSPMLSLAPSTLRPRLAAAPSARPLRRCVAVRVADVKVSTAFVWRRV